MRKSILATVIVTVVGLMILTAYLATPVARAADPARGGALAAGTPVIVYLRGDSVGMSVNYSGGPRNTPSVSGTVVSADDQWLVLDKAGAQTTVSRAAILLVDVVKK